MRRNTNENCRSDHTYTSLTDEKEIDLDSREKTNLTKIEALTDAKKDDPTNTLALYFRFRWRRGVGRFISLSDVQFHWRFRHDLLFRYCKVHGFVFTGGPISSTIL